MAEMNIPKRLRASVGNLDTRLVEVRAKRSIIARVRSEIREFVNNTG